MEVVVVEFLDCGSGGVRGDGSGEAVYFIYC